MRVRECSELPHKSCKLRGRGRAGWVSAVPKELGVQPGRCSYHWGFSPSIVLASSLAGGGDFPGEAEVVGLGLPDPD